MEKRPKQKDDIFSTPTSHAYGSDPMPENFLLNRRSYHYTLPEDKIAHVPLEDRAASKMLVLDRYTGVFNDLEFRDFTSFLNEGDVIVVNNTKVIPARVFGLCNDQPIELLMVRPEGDSWKVMVDIDVEIGDVIIFTNGGTAAVQSIEEDGSITMVFNEDVWELLDEVGHTPLPPYIKNQEQLEANGIAERYNTVYANESTSVAAPTAGLHFTEEVLGNLMEKGVTVLGVRLDVGLGTFRPVVVNDIRNHHMHEEHIAVKQGVIECINEAKKNGKRVIAIGTTALRTLESIPTEVWENPADFETDTGIFIYPGSGRKITTVDGLFTNFHAPESTLMMLVSVVAGYEPIMRAYNHAVHSDYRFLSLGDCMLILGGE